MSLQIAERENEGIIVLDLKGPLTLGHGDLELRDRLPALHQSGKVNIIVNLKDVSNIDSTGLGTLVFGLARLRKTGGRLALVNLNRAHLELFLLTKLAIAFEFFDDEQDVVNEEHCIWRAPAHESHWQRRRGRPERSRYNPLN